MISEARKRRLFRDLDKRDPKFVKKLEPFLKAMYDVYFRVDVAGWENVPNHKALYVGNHNGMVTFEVVMMFYAWYRKFGFERRALGLAHGVALENPLFRWICPRIGAIPASPDIAEEAFNRDYSLLVYPGGDKESLRPFSKRKEVDFFQRKGFIRLALKAGVPIVPIVSVGSHETYVVVHQGEELAKRLGLYDKFRLHGIPINLQSVFFMWCVTTGLVTFFPLLLAPAAFASILIPLPAKMDFQILPEVDVVSLIDRNKTDEENHQSIYDHVLGKIRETHSQMYAKRKYPVIG